MNSSVNLVEENKMASDRLSPLVFRMVLSNFCQSFGDAIISHYLITSFFNDKFTLIGGRRRSLLSQHGTVIHSIIL